MKISVVIPLFNCAEVFRPCLDSLMVQLPDCAEVIVVDNGSFDEAVPFIRRNYPAVRVVQNKKNEGAAKARNQGIELSRTPWVMTLDCDVVIKKDFFDEVLRGLGRAGGRTGMVQAKIMNQKGDAFFSTGIQLTALRRFYDRGRGQKDFGQFDRKLEIFGPCAAAAVYSRRMLEEIKDEFGYFDERFFFLAEDVDLAWRAQRAGWKSVYCPGAVCFHRGNSSGTGHRLRQYLCFRNRDLMLKKNETPAGRLRQIMLSPFYDLPRRLYGLLTNPYFTHPPQL